MGGGKKKKTISAAEKQQRKEELGEVKKPERRDKGASAIASLEIDDALLNRALSTIKSSDVVTTYQLATALGVRMSLARRVIKELSARGDVRIIDKFRALYVVGKAA
ncbi:MAG: hypothetical protein QXX81_04570 [Zestosphaera sp.]